jgi:hypothetical protein
MRGEGIGDRLIALFLLGVLLLTPPLMAIFNVDRLVLGIPVLYLYLFGAWVVLVGLLILFLRPRRSEATDRRPGPNG